MAASLAPAFAADEVFVSNYYGGSIHVFARTANGDVTRTRAIRTGLSLPHDVAIDLLHRELFVPNNQPAGQDPAINAFDLDAGSPGLGDAPRRTISGPLTLLNRPAGLVVDSIHQEMYGSHRERPPLHGIERQDMLRSASDGAIDYFDEALHLVADPAQGGCGVSVQFVDHRTVGFASGRGAARDGLWA
jgi:hypothetical protein